MSSVTMSHPEIANQVLQDLQNLNVVACVGDSTALIIHGIQRPQPSDVDILIYHPSGNGNAVKTLLSSNFGARYASDNANNLFFRQEIDTAYFETSIQLLCAGPYASLGWLRLDIPHSSVIIQGIQTLNLSFYLLSKLVGTNTRLQDLRPGAKSQQKGQRDKADVLHISRKMQELGARFEGTLSRAANLSWRYFDRDDLLLLERIGVRIDRK